MSAAVREPKSSEVKVDRNHQKLKILLVEDNPRRRRAHLQAPPEDLPRTGHLPRDRSRGGPEDLTHPSG